MNNTQIVAWVVVSNGAVIKSHTHATEEQAYASAFDQAQSWSKWNPGKAIRIERFAYLGFDQGFERYPSASLTIQAKGERSACPIYGKIDCACGACSHG